MVLAFALPTCAFLGGALYADIESHGQREQLKLTYNSMRSKLPSVSEDEMPDPGIDWGSALSVGAGLGVVSAAVAALFALPGYRKRSPAFESVSEVEAAPDLVSGTALSSSRLVEPAQDEPISPAQQGGADVEDSLRNRRVFVPNEPPVPSSFLSDVSIEEDTSGELHRWHHARTLAAELEIELQTLFEQISASVASVVRWREEYTRWSRKQGAQLDRLQARVRTLQAEGQDALVKASASLGQLGVRQKQWVLQLEEIGFELEAMTKTLRPGGDLEVFHAPLFDTAVITRVHNSKDKLQEAFLE